MVDLNNAGAAFTINAAVSDMSVHDLPIETPTGAPYCHIPNPEKQLQGEEPLLSITLTHFQGGGCTLGIVINHAICDGWTFAMFVKDRSDLHNGQAIEPVEFQLPEVVMASCANRREVNEAAELLGQKRSPLIKRWMLKFLFFYVLPKMLKSDPREGSKQADRLILSFTNDEVQRIKQKAEGRSNTWISTSEAMMVHIWIVMLDAADISCRMALAASIPVNLRDKLKGVSPRVAGNAFVILSVRCDASNNDSFVQRLHNTMRSSLEETKLMNLVRLQNYVWRNHSHTFDWHEDAELGDVAMGGSPGMISWNNQVSSPFFNIDFGAGKPLRGVLWNWKQPVTAMPRPRGGIDVYIDKSERGHGSSWTKKQPFWGIARNCFLLGAAGSVVAVTKIGVRKWLPAGPVALFGGAMWALANHAGSRAREQSHQSEKGFYDAIEKNAHNI